MSIFKRGEVYWTKFKINGKEIRRTTGAKNKKQALIIERRIKYEFTESLEIKDEPMPTDHTYGEALLKWLQNGAPESMMKHIKVTRDYIPDETPLHAVVPVAHDMKQAMLGKQLKPSTINRRLAVVRRILNIAYQEWDWLKEPLGQKIRLLSEKGLERTTYLTRDEVKQLVEHIEDETVKRITMLAAYTGLRQGEIRKLKPEHWQKPFIILGTDNKGKKPRSIPLIEDLHYIMESTDFNVSEWDIRKHFEAAREAIERPDIHFHDLRHTFASWLIANPEIPLTLVRDLLGHSNISVTNKYIHLRGADVSIIEGALKGVQSGGTVKTSNDGDKN